MKVNRIMVKFVKENDIFIFCDWFAANAFLKDVSKKAIERGDVVIEKITAID